jgi:hypothetical protein
MFRSDTFALSGAECVLALCALGFTVVRRQPGGTILRAGSHVLVVPDMLILPTRVLDTIIADADVSYSTLLGAVEDLPTEPELSVIEAL